MYQSRWTAKNSWWRAERLPETRRVVIPIKLEFGASVGFIHKEYRSEFLVSERHKLNITSCKGTWWIKVRKLLFTSSLAWNRTSTLNRTSVVVGAYNNSPEDTSSKNQLCFPDCVIVWVTCGYWTTVDVSCAYCWLCRHSRLLGKSSQRFSWQCFQSNNNFVSYLSSNEY